jgi:hypothetical protein
VQKGTAANELVEVQVRSEAYQLTRPEAGEVDRGPDPDCRKVTTIERGEGMIAHRTPRSLGRSSAMSSHM